MEPGIDPTRVEAFQCTLQASTSTRISSEMMWSAFARAFPHRPAGPPERTLLLAALRALEASGAIRLPQLRGARWDRSIFPAVPRSIDLVRSEEASSAPEWRNFPWHAKLQWVVQCRGLSAEQIRFLERVHEGFVDNRFEQPAPLKYRSLQLTGDEKRLGVLTLTSLFGDGRLTLQQLGCQSEPVPLAWESVGSGDRMLIFENAGPFSVARRALLALASSRPYDAVAYGGGQSLAAGIGHLKSLERRFGSLHYVGDLDAAGLQIAALARARCEELGLPPLKPATELHRAMLHAAAAFGHAEGWPSEQYAEVEAAPLVEVLDPEMREPVIRLLSLRRRIPEEVLGPAELRLAWLQYA